MSGLSSEYDQMLQDCIARVAGKRKIVASCLYGSRVAGYSHPKSDFDIILVLEDYPYIVRYAYDKRSSLDISVLVVDRKSIERDAKGSFLGEFVIGRLLHIYRPIVNPEFFAELEEVYKKRVILEEINDIVLSTNVLSTEVLFPMEFIMFSKIKRRAALYPNASYSYYRTYAGDGATNNIEFALAGYYKALEEIVKKDSKLFQAYGGPRELLQISEKRIEIGSGGRVASLKLPRRLSDVSSYFVHTYAGRESLQPAIKEAEAKIRRHRAQHVNLPDFMSYPRKIFWKLPEGHLVITDAKHKDWLDSVASASGFTDYAVPMKRRLGNINSRTILYVIREKNGRNKKEIVVKEMSKSKAVKWAALNVWTSPVKRFRVDPLFRLGSEYKALRHVRKLGLQTPLVEAVVLDKRLLVTQFISGATLADAIKQTSAESEDLVRLAGKKIAKIHNSGSSLGNIKPKNVIVHEGELYFTDLEQFQFNNNADNVWDLAQFISWGLKRTRNTKTATAVTKGFLEGYLEVAENKTAENVTKLSKSNRYIESFYPVLLPSVAKTIKKEIKNMSK